MDDTYFLTQDNDSHWYVVPTSREAEWAAWTDLDSNDEKAWSAPAFAKEVGGSPTRVKFADWRIE